MTYRHLTAGFFSLCPLLGVSSLSHAAFVNITIEKENQLFENHPNFAVRSAWADLNGTLDVYRVYANFGSSTADDHVHRIFGTAVAPSYLNSSNGTFHNFTSINPKTNEIDHFDSPVSPSFYGSTPALAWDTFVAVGFGPFFWNSGFFEGPGGASLGHLQSNWTNTSVEWRHGPLHSEEGDAVPGGPSGFRVGLFQATVAAGTQITGQFALDTGYGIIWGANTAFSTIPAPAGLAALLLLGATPRRRRH